MYKRQPNNIAIICPTTVAIGAPFVPISGNPDVYKRQINEKAKAIVQITLTTYDEDLCKKIEPDVSTTKERIEMCIRDRNARNLA